MIEHLKPKLIESLRGYQRKDFVADLIAGITVGLVALPLAMAFGIASGVTPQAGIYTVGHTSCGAVTAVARGEKLPTEIAHLVAPIRIAFEKVKALHPELKEQAMIRSTVRLTVLDTVATLMNGPKILNERIKAGQLRIEGGVYDIETGRVSWV